MDPKTGQPVWLVEARRRGNELVIRECGKPVAAFTRRQLADALRDETRARPPRLDRQDKVTLVAEVERWVVSEHCGSAILRSLKEMVGV